MTRTPPAFGAPATRLHAGRILLVLTLLVGTALATWVWIFHKDAGKNTAVTESSTTPGWTAAQMHYEKPEVRAEAPAAAPVDMTAAELARLRTMLAQMQAEIDALKNRKLPAATTVVQQQPKSEPPKKVPGSMLFVSHDVKPGPPPTPKFGPWIFRAWLSVPETAWSERCGITCGDTPQAPSARKRAMAAAVAGLPRWRGAARAPQSRKLPLCPLSAMAW